MRKARRLQAAAPVEAMLSYAVSGKAEFGFGTKRPTPVSKRGWWDSDAAALTF